MEAIKPLQFVLFILVMTSFWVISAELGDLDRLLDTPSWMDNADGNI